jgi:hypothetical protein
MKQHQIQRPVHCRVGVGLVCEHLVNKSGSSVVHAQSDSGRKIRLHLAVRCHNVAGVR